MFVQLSEYYDTYFSSIYNTKVKRPHRNTEVSEWNVNITNLGRY